MSELARTYLSAAAAGVLAFVMVAGIAWFLGFPTGTAVISGLVAAVLGTALLLGAAKRSGHLEAPDPERRLLDPEGTRAPHSTSRTDEDDRA